MALYKKILIVFAVVVSACGNRATENLTSQEILKKGAQLYTTHGCNVCHSLDNRIVYGPPLNDVYLKEITVIRNGSERILKADRKYLLRAIKEPGYEKDIAYRNKEMPVTSMPKHEAELLVEYLVVIGSEKPVK